MAVTISYPDNLPDFRLGKKRKQVQTYRTSQPFNGPLFIEKITDESPVVWRMTVTCTSTIQARIFQAFLRKVNNGQPFIKDILTEEGHIAHEVRFVEMPLEPDQSSGSTIWSYTGLIQAIKLIQPDAEIDDDLIILYLDQSNVIDIAVNIDWPLPPVVIPPSRLSSPLVHLFTNDKTVEKLTNGTLTTDRATIGTFIDKTDGLLKTAAIDTIREETEGFLIEGTSTNLFLRSEEFDNAAWVKTDSSIVTGSIVAPDGTLTASEHIEGIGSSTKIVRQNLTIPAGAAAISMFVKAGVGGRSITLRSNITGQQATFNPFTGMITSESAVGIGKIVPLVNGWFRCSVSFTSTGAADNIRYYISDGDDLIYQGDGTSFNYIWGAQLELLPFASSYIKTTTTAVTRSDDDVSILSAGNILPNIGSYLAEVSFLGDPGAALFMTYFSANDGSANNRNQVTILDGSFVRAVGSSGGVNQWVATGSSLPPNTTQNVAVTYEENDVRLYQDGINTVSDSSALMPLSFTKIDIGKRVAGQEQMYGHISDLMIYDFVATPTEIAQIQG